MTKPVTDPFGRRVCGVESTAAMSFMAAGRYCSLDPVHVDDPDSPHVAYDRHIVTGHGRDVIWLGPWADARPYTGAQTTRLLTEWEQRHEYNDQFELDAAKTDPAP